MGLGPTAVIDLLDVARDLTSQNPLDTEVVLELLDTMPFEYLDAQTRSAVTHARFALATALSGDPDQIAASRFALARVVVLLERRVMIQTPW